MQKINRVIAVVGLLCLLPGVAGALPFTLASDVDFNQNGVAGSIVAVDPGSFDLGSAVCGAGACDSNTQDFLLFQVMIGAGGLEGLNASFTPPPFNVPWEGAGYIDGDDVEPAVSIVNNVQARYEWASLTGTSEVLFAASLGNLSDGEEITFAISPSGPGQTFQAFGEAVVIVPEPTTMALIGLGVLALATRGRSRR